MTQAAAPSPSSRPAHASRRNPSRHGRCAPRTRKPSRLRIHLDRLAMAGTGGAAENIRNLSARARACRKAAVATAIARHCPPMRAADGPARSRLVTGSITSSNLQGRPHGPLPAHARPCGRPTGRRERGLWFRTGLNVPHSSTAGPRSSVDQSLVRPSPASRGPRACDGKRPRTPRECRIRLTRVLTARRDLTRPPCSDAPIRSGPPASPPQRGCPHPRPRAKSSFWLPGTFVRTERKASTLAQCAVVCSAGSRSFGG